MRQQNADALMDRMRKKTARVMKTDRPLEIRFPVKTVPLPLSPVLKSVTLLLCEYKQQHHESLVYSSPQSVARHYHDITSGTNPLTSYLQIVPNEPLWDLQEEAVRFLVNREHDVDLLGTKGALFGDDMGLGKTRTILTLILRENQERARLTGKRFNCPTLIIAPDLVIDNWVVEIEKFPPDTFVYFNMNDRQNTEEKVDRFYFEHACDIVLVSYNTVILAARKEVREAHFPGSILFGTPWFRVVADEAQQLVTQTSLIARALGEMNAKIKIAVTGTPIQNCLNDLHSLMAFIGITEELDKTRLSLLLSKLMLRRTKEEIPATLRAPCFTRTYYHIRLLEFATGAERLLYYAYAKYALMVRESRSNKTDPLPLVIQWLRQLCIGPHMVKNLVLPSTMLLLNGSATTRDSNLKDFMEKAFSHSTRILYREGDAYRKNMDSFPGLSDDDRLERIVNFEWSPTRPRCCPDAAHYAMLERELMASHGRATETMVDDCVSFEETKSGLRHIRTERTIDLNASSTMERAIVTELQRIPKGEKVNILSVYVWGLRHLQQILHCAGFKTALVVGDQNRTVNQAEFRRFRSDPDVTCLLSSLKIGAAGHNLREANHVFLLGLWWTPFPLLQAASRPQRDGQTKDVHVVYFVIDHTIDLYILNLLSHKKGLLESVAVTNVTNEEVSETDEDHEPCLNEEEVRQLFDYTVTVTETNKCQI